MSINYRVVKRAQPGVAGGGEIKYYAQVSKRGKISFEDLCERIAKMTTFSEADVVGVLHSLVKLVPDLLKGGYTVDLDALGLFSIYIKSQGRKDPDKVTSRDIREARIHFRPSVRMKKMVLNARYTKVKD